MAVRSRRLGRGVPITLPLSVTSPPQSGSLPPSTRKASRICRRIRRYFRRNSPRQDWFGIFSGKRLDLAQPHGSRLCSAAGTVLLSLASTSPDVRVVVEGRAVGAAAVTGTTLTRPILRRTPPKPFRRRGLNHGVKRARAGRPLPMGGRAPGTKQARAPLIETRGHAETCAQVRRPGRDVYGSRRSRPSQGRNATAEETLGVLVDSALPRVLLPLLAPITVHEARRRGRLARASWRVAVRSRLQHRES